MNINDKHYHTIWIHPDNKNVIQIIDQRLLPFEFKVVDLCNIDDVYVAIKDMKVRGAPLIGVTAAFGMYLALLNFKKNENLEKYIEQSADKLKSSRPTAINLNFAIDKVLSTIINSKSIEDKIHTSFETAKSLLKEELENSIKIGNNGLELIKKVANKKNGQIINILTHCNAGWLACIDYGTATAPIYMAHDEGINIHVWVDETRPRNQGARLTAWELSQHGVPCTLIPDNTGGHLMQHAMVDLVLVGSDRTTVDGDVTNKIGTYLKALAAYDNNVPFYVALPSSSIDWNIEDGIRNIPIEERDVNEVKYMEGLGKNGVDSFLITSENIYAKNYGFDVTPSRLISEIITERGICKPNRESILELYPEKI